ncbi:MAG: hypothetical protein ACE5ID_01395 [Acidobacteriota bacterium]
MSHRILIILLLLLAVAPLRADAPAGSPAAGSQAASPEAAVPPRPVPAPQETGPRRPDPSAAKKLKTFVPKEKVRADVPVSFPVDI